MKYTPNQNLLLSLENTLLGEALSLRNSDLTIADLTPVQEGETVLGELLPIEIAYHVLREKKREQHAKMHNGGTVEATNAAEHDQLAGAEEVLGQLLSLSVYQRFPGRHRMAIREGNKIVVIPQKQKRTNNFSGMEVIMVEIVQL